MTHTTLYAENATYKAVEVGTTHLKGDHTILIQICDDSIPHPQPFDSFHSIHQFTFNDVDPGQEGGMTLEQAFDMCDIIEEALLGKKNICVHCVAGLCRSGAVVEFLSMVGFTPVMNDRIPNIQVKRALITEWGKRQ